MARKGGGDDKISDFIDWFFYLPIKYRYMQIHQARNGDMNLLDIFKLNEICLYQEAMKEEALNNGKK